jgi:putative N-acetylmannosamine-6-phosphate epimerase
MVTPHSAITWYVDASTNPVNGQPSPRRAGLGIFIVNLQVQPTNYIYIRASLQETHSVISAEAATIALAAVVLHRMDHHQVSFLSDCAHLVDLLNSYDHSNLPDWRMKPHI